MSIVDRQRIAVVKVLEAMGYKFRNATGGSPEADAMHALLVQRADQLQGCVVGSAEDQELSAIVRAIVGYEQKRWPAGQITGWPKLNQSGASIATAIPRATRYTTAAAAIGALFTAGTALVAWYAY